MRHEWHKGFRNVQESKDAVFLRGRCESGMRETESCMIGRKAVSLIPFLIGQCFLYQVPQIPWCLNSLRFVFSFMMRDFIPVIKITLCSDIYSRKTFMIE